MVKSEQKGGSCASNKVGGTASGDIKAPTFMEDIFNITDIMPEPTETTKMVGGAKKTRKSTKGKRNTKKHNKKSKSKKSTSKKEKKTKGRKMTHGAKRSTMRGGGVLNMMGCGPVNNASTFKNPGCNRDTIMKPPMLGNAGSGIGCLNGHAAV